MTYYTLNTNHWTENEKIMELWTPDGKVWQTQDEAEAVRHLAYFRMAYQDSTFVLLADGYVVSTAELAAMARHILIR